MTINIQSNRVQYIGDASTTSFPYVFRLHEDDEMVVVVDGVVQTITTHYTITNNGDETGGSIDFVAAPALDALITIYRSMDLVQELNLIEYDRFPAESVEAALDRLVCILQDQGMVLSRSPQQSIEDYEENLEFPKVAGEFIKWNSAGDALETSSISDLGESVVASATDLEITTGTETADRLVSPAQVKLGVETHQHNITVLTAAEYAALGTKDPDTFYFVTA